MKLKLCVLFCCAFTNATAAVNQYASTNLEVLGQIHVSDGTYYFQSQDSNWSAPNCPNARYAYINEAQPGAKAILSVALTSKATNAAIQFGGLCGDSNGDDIYIRVQFIAFP